MTLQAKKKINNYRNKGRRHFFAILHPLLSGPARECSFMFTPGRKKRKEKHSANTFSGEKTQNHKYTSVSKKSFIQKKSITTNLCYLKLNWECLRAVIMEFVSTVIC